MLIRRDPFPHLHNGGIKDVDIYDVALLFLDLYTVSHTIEITEINSKASNKVFCDILYRYCKSGGYQAEAQ